MYRGTGEVRLGDVHLRGWGVKLWEGDPQDSRSRLKVVSKRGGERENML